MIELRMDKKILIKINGGKFKNDCI
jgi:hypothetical protein